MANYNVQLIHVNDDNTMDNMNPISSANNIKLTPTNNIPEDATNVKDVLEDLGVLAFKDKIEAASQTTAGVTKLSDSITTSDSNVAASSKAVKAINDNSVKKTGNETITGIKTFTDGMKIGEAQITFTEDSSGNRTLIFDLI